SLWLPATDHVEEGTFRWLENYEEVLVGNWSAGTPSRNRSVNCLALNQDGFYVEESCTSWDIRYHTLCELPMFRWGKEEGGRTNGVEILSKFQGIPSIQSLVEIGGVGNKRYFVDENPPEEGRLWTGSWDFCHEHDLRMAAPESMEELYFLTNYSKQENDAS
ncbi:Ribulose bisphosphate carboxylase small chain, chloroplastic, partial [Folsomia candida]